jgi:hypothetical protein
MSMSRYALAALVMLGTGAAFAQTPGLGHPVSPAEIAELDLIVTPDGSTLPPGSGSVEAGATLFAERCAACHGGQGEGMFSLTRLVGGSLTAPEGPVKTVGNYWPHASTLFDYIRRAMPANAPKSLTDDQVYSAVAYVLFLNGLLPADATLDRVSLAAIEMPNRDGFIDMSDVLE